MYLCIFMFILYIVLIFQVPRNYKNKPLLHQSWEDTAEVITGKKSQGKLPQMSGMMKDFGFITNKEQYS